MSPTFCTCTPLWLLVSTFCARPDTWYHQTSGLLYLACSSKAGRHAWLPNGDHYDLAKRPNDDYFAILDTKGTGPVAERIKKIKPQGFAGNDGQGSYNLHGFGVYLGAGGAGSDDLMRLFVINHRPQPEADRIGANSTIEIFESALGSSTMRHIRTHYDPAVISTPNDLVPVGPDAFVFSNDHSVKLGPKKQLDFFLPRSSIGHCNAKGCKISMSPVQYPNGMAGGANHPHKDAHIIYQASTSTPYIQVLELQADNSLVLVRGGGMLMGTYFFLKRTPLLTHLSICTLAPQIDRIRTDYIMDNLSVDEEGAVWAAGFPKAFAVIDQMKNPHPKAGAPAVALRITKNKGQGAFYGEKYKVERMVEDDGNTLNFVTTVSYDTERKMAFLGSE